MNAPLGFTTYVVPAPKSLLAAEHAPCAHRPEADEPSPESTTSWPAVHRRLLAIGTQRAQLERELSQWLVAAERLGVAARCGMASLFEYADRHLGLSYRQTEERLRVGKPSPSCRASTKPSRRAPSPSATCARSAASPPTRRSRHGSTGP